MTDFKNENPNSRQNRLSSQKENFDFELVEVQVTPDQMNPAPSHLDNFIDDEDAIDRLLIDAHFNTNEEPQVVTTESDDYDSIDRMLSNQRFNHQEEQHTNPAPADVVASEPTPIEPPAQAVPEIKTNFYVDYFDKRKKIKTTNPEPVESEPEINQPADKPSPVNNRPQNAMNNPTPTEEIHSEQPLDSHAPMFNGSGMAVAVLSQFKSKQESINKQQEKLIQDFSQKIKAATTITYAAVFFGVVALAAATTLGVMLVKTKSEVSDLAGTTTALKDNIKAISKGSPDDLEGTDPAIDQLNQKVEEVMEQLKEQSQVSNSGLKNEVTALQNKVLQLEKSAAKATANKPLDIAQPPVVVVEKKPAVEPIVKTTLTAKTLKKPIVEHVAPASVAITTAKPTTKTANKSIDTPKIDKAQAVLPANDINNLVKPAATAPAPQTAIANTPRAPQAATANTARAPQAGTSSGWTVNLGSSNKLDDAKKTAARFAQKGISVAINPVTVKNETRYRLQVKGFKSKDEAAAYANKAKDALKLDSVWINP